MAFSFNDKFLSGTTKSKSTSNFVPNPSQVGQAPNGLLNENNLGSISSIEKPQIGHAWCSLNNNSSEPITSTIAFPSPSFNAASKESDNLPETPSFTTTRSMTTSIECFLFL